MGDKKRAKYWVPGTKRKESKELECQLCPFGCIIQNNTTGKCGARTNIDGELLAVSYGKVTSVALDPIEKKPLYMFHPGCKIISIGSYGCNLTCPYCQNHTISLEYEKGKADYLTPETVLELSKLSMQDGNIGVAYTYNEPLIGYEFVLECSKLIRSAGLKNVLVTNGYINEAPLTELITYIDAMNIDIKGNTDRTYNMVGGTSKHAKRTVELAYSKCHVEVTTLVVPGVNEDEIEDIARWLASLDPDIPYHLSRFFPGYKYKDHSPTPFDMMHKASDIAKTYLKNVYLGNM